MICAIINPAAGGGRCTQRALASLEGLETAGYAVLPVFTDRPGAARDMARREYERGHREFLVLGGDGTLCDVLSGLLLARPPVAPGQVPEPTAARPPDSLRLGVLPLGTGNSFIAHFTGLGGTGSAVDYRQRALNLYLDALREDRDQPCDVLRIDHDAGSEYALGAISFGFPAQVADLANRRLKRFGSSAYALGVILQLARLRSVEFHLEGSGRQPFSRAGKATFLAVQNVEYVGGRMKMAPGASPHDGEAEAVWVAPVGRFELLRTFPRIFAGRHVTHPAVSLLHFERLEFLEAASPNPTDAAAIASPLHTVMLDGEVMRIRPKRIVVLPAAIKMRI